MPKAKYLSYSKIELENLVQKHQSIEEILEEIGYVQTRDERVITSFKQHLSNLNISYTHLSDEKKMVICKQCKQIKDVSEFYQSKGKVTQKICKECVRMKERQKYHSVQEQLNSLKENKTCAKCGCSKYYLLDFHHIDPSQKEFSISDNPHAKIQTLLKEIKKCICLCSNCHREFHFLNRKKQITLEEYLNGGME